MSYDNDKVQIDNTFGYCYGCGENVANISAADSPHTVPLRVCSLLADASAANVLVNLQSTNNNPGKRIVVKKTDSSTNQVIIYPPVGETIDGAASYTLRRFDEAVTFVRNPLTSNWEITSDQLESIMVTKGDIIAYDGTKFARMPVGTPGQVLSVDLAEPTGLKWITSAMTNRVSYMIQPNEINVAKPNYISLAFFPWLHSRYSSYTNGVVIFYATIANRQLDIQIYNSTAATSLGSLVGIAASGWYSFAISSPVANALLELQVKKSGAGGQNPRIYGCTLEFDV